MFELNNIDPPTQPPPSSPKLADIIFRLLSLRPLSRRARQKRRLSVRRVAGFPADAAYFPFMQLPTEVILEITKALQVEDVISLSMTCRTLYELSFTPSLWKSQAREHLALSRPLIIPSTSPSTSSNLPPTYPIIPTLSHLAPSSLRASVLSTTRLTHSWSHAFSRATGVPSITKLSIPLSDPRCVISCVTPRHLLVVSRATEGVGGGDQELVGWDMEKDRCVGRYRLRETLMSARAEWTTGSCYYVAGRCIGMSTFEFSLIRVQFLNETAPPVSRLISPIPDGANANTINSSTSSSMSPSSDNSNTGTLNDSVSDPDINIDLMSTSTFARYAMPFSAEITVHILDVAVRMVAVLFEWKRGARRGGGSARRDANGGVNDGETDKNASTLGVIMMFDWESGESAGFDTGLAFTYPITTASVHLTPSRGHLMVYTDTDAHVETSMGKKEFGKGKRKVVDLGRLRSCKGAGKWEDVVEDLFGKGRERGRGKRGMGCARGCGGVEEEIVDYGWDVRVTEMEPPAIRREVEARRRRSGAAGSSSSTVWRRAAKHGRTRRSSGASAGVDVAARDVRVGRRSSDTSRSDTGVDLEVGREERRLLEAGGVGFGGGSRRSSRTRSNSRSVPANVPVLDSSTRICMWSRHENWPVFDDEAGNGLAPALPPAPARSSRISLHAVPVTKDAPGSAGGRMWYIVQNYLSSMPSTSSLTTSTSTPSSKPRLPLTVLPLSSPVLKHLSPNQNHILPTQSWPLLGISFNRVCWIEVVSPKRMSVMRRGRRVVRVATFPEPGEEVGMGSARVGNPENGEDGYGWPNGTTVTTLDIPSRVLRNACHLLLSEVRGTVTVVSNANEVYTYSFA